jgi:glutaconate CoA-transferase subunit A
VHAVVPVPFGAHPHSVHNRYDYDPIHLAAYDAAARTDETFARYLDRYVHEPADHAGYLEAVGGAARLEELLPRSGLGYNPELPRKIGVPS